MPGLERLANLVASSGVSQDLFHFKPVTTIFKKLFSVLIGPRNKKRDLLREWENQHFLPPLEWTKAQRDTYHWLTSIEHDQRKRLRSEPGAIVLCLAKEAPDRGETLMKISVQQSQSGDSALFELGAILISPDGEIAEGNELVTLLIALRSSDPLRPPGPRSLH